MLLEGDLLKLGKVLLLAQETANNSIERALRRRRTGRAGGEASPADGCTYNSAARGALPVGRQHGRACGNECTGSRSVETCGGKHKEPASTTTENNGESISRDRSRTSRRLGRDPKYTASSFALPRPRQHERLNGTGAVPDTDAAAATAAGRASLASQNTPCLWCNPASAADRQRWHRVAALAKMKDHHRHDIIRQAVAYRRQGATAVRARQPRRVGNSSSQSPPPAMRQNAPRRRRSINEPLQQAPLSPSERTFDVVAVEIDDQGQRRPLADSSQDPISFGADGLSTDRRQQEQIDHLSWCNPSPGPFFCSWECAGRWNAKFSPVQARHERGLRIDIAAGRVVAR